MAIAEVAVVAPSLAVGLPPKPTAGSGMDAMAHNAEGRSIFFVQHMVV